MQGFRAPAWLSEIDIELKDKAAPPIDRIKNARRTAFQCQPIRCLGLWGG